MRNTTKLKHILQLYTVSMDMDDEQNIELTLIGKRSRHSQTFVNKSYSTVLAKAFSYMMKEIKKDAQFNI